MRLPPEILLPIRDPLGAQVDLVGFRVESGIVGCVMVADGKTFGRF